MVNIKIKIEILILNMNLFKMTTINIIPDVCKKHIFSYLGCILDDKCIYITCKDFLKLTTCILNNYHNNTCKNVIEGCNLHRKKYYNVINNLKNLETRKYVNTVHFEDKIARLIATPYARKFGFISHFCCNGSGISYINNNKKKKLDFQNFKLRSNNSTMPDNVIDEFDLTISEEYICDYDDLEEEMEEFE